LKDVIAHMRRADEIAAAIQAEAYSDEMWGGCVALREELKAALNGMEEAGY